MMKVERLQSKSDYAFEKILDSFSDERRWVQRKLWAIVLYSVSKRLTAAYLNRKNVSFAIRACRRTGLSCEILGLKFLEKQWEERLYELHGFNVKRKGLKKGDDC